MFFNNYQKKQDYAESFEKKGELILSQLEASTKNLLWNYNHSDLKKVTKAIGQDKEVAIINIYNSNFQFIEKVSIDKRGNEAYQDKFLHNFPKEFKKIDGNDIFALEIKKNEEVAGYVELVLTDFYIRNQYMNNLKKEIFMNIIILFLFILVIIFANWFFIQKNIYLSEKVKQKTQELNETNKKLKLLNKNLEARVEKKTEIIKRTERELIKQEKLASLGALVSGVAHEINTPLGIAITSASFIDKLNKNLSDKVENGTISKKEFLSKLSKITESIDTLNINLKKAADLIKDFKKISVKQSQDEKVIFNIYDYFESIIASLKPKLKKGNYKINLDCDKNLEIYSFPGVFSQVFTNLIMNSIIHGFKEKDSGKINIEIEKKEDILYIKYSDNGVGISEDNLGKIYDPFFTTNRKNGGSGLGLAVIYNLINDKLNGKIKCESKKNQGVIFKIEVNLAK